MKAPVPSQCFPILEGLGNYDTDYWLAVEGKMQERVFIILSPFFGPCRVDESGILFLRYPIDNNEEGIGKS